MIPDFQQETGEDQHNHQPINVVAASQNLTAPKGQYQVPPTPPAPNTPGAPEAAFSSDNRVCISYSVIKLDQIAYLI